MEIDKKYSEGKKQDYFLSDVKKINFISQKRRLKSKDQQT